MTEKALVLGELSPSEEALLKALQDLATERRDNETRLSVLALICHMALGSSGELFLPLDLVRSPPPFRVEYKATTQEGIEGLLFSIILQEESENHIVH